MPAWPFFGTDIRVVQHLAPLSEKRTDYIFIRKRLSANRTSSDGLRRSVFKEQYIEFIISMFFHDCALSDFGVVEYLHLQ